MLTRPKQVQQSDSLREQILSLGAREFLPKPFELRALSQALERLIACISGIRSRSGQPWARESLSRQVDWIC